ncbi:MAG: hypothetical protein LW832_04700 [Parachlamydia sp.]|jgi:hypothetical protein|nr:hypothetical protein [Parachlamydia sp.]
MSNKGMHFSDDLFEPEDVIFLASSFEALFDIDDKHMASDFKQKLRPLLHLKFAKPLEIFWKWVDDFYDSRRKILHGGPLPDPQFKLNPNFDISHLLIGIKLFIYSVYYNLHLYGLIKSTHEDAYSPPDFKWIHPEEVLLFFWTEESLLKKIIICLDESRANNEENLADLHALMNLFSSMMERYFLRPEQDGILFIPTPLPAIQSMGEKILGKSRRGMTDRFIRSLQKRMERL